MLPLGNLNGTEVFHLAKGIYEGCKALLEGANKALEKAPEAFTKLGDWIRGEGPRRNDRAQQIEVNRWLSELHQQSPATFPDRARVVSTLAAQGHHELAAKLKSAPAAEPWPPWVKRPTDFFDSPHDDR